MHFFTNEKAVIPNGPACALVTGIGRFLPVKVIQCTGQVECKWVVNCDVNGWASGMQFPTFRTVCSHLASGAAPESSHLTQIETRKARVFSCLTKILLPLAFTINIAIGIVCAIAGPHRQQAGDSPATTARGKPDPSPLTGIDWLSNESSFKNGHFHCCTWLAGCIGKTTE